jgi:N4-bis(aminopropyl)spermidine synthase
MSGPTPRPAAGKPVRTSLSADSPSPESPLAAVQELKSSFGIDARRIDAVGCLLTDGEFRSVDELVSLTGTSRRTVEAVLQAAERHLESAGGRVRIGGSHAAAYAGEFGCAERAPVRDPWDEMARRDPPALAEAAGLVDRAPAPQRDLDQVPATAVTVLKRGHYLRRNFELRGAQVLCVGDHDLTSLGLFLAGGAAGLRVSVVDVDEALLQYIGTEAGRRGFDIRCYFADLRLGLPAALQDSAQLVFTDPPYTAEGVHLFVTRGLQGLGDQRNGRVLVAYGFGEQQPALGLAVQEALAPLHLTYEAVLPGFNRYSGAQAIGSAAALYQLRPTRRTGSAARASADALRPELYTHGAQSVESSPPPLDDAAAATILGLAAGPDEAALLAGGGWPAGPHGQRLTLPALMTAPGPGQRPDHDVAVINLYPGFGSLVLRALLAANARRVAVVCRNDVAELRDAAGQQALAQLIAPKYRIARLLRSTPRPDMAVIVAEQAPAAALTAAGQVAACVYARPHGKIGNAWREGLIAAAKSRGDVLTKREARRIIDLASAGADAADHCLLDLPRHLLPVLRMQIEQSAEALLPA